MPVDIPNELIKSTVNGILELLTDSESSESDDSDDDFVGKSKYDLTTALLIYAGTLTNDIQRSDDSEYSEFEAETDNSKPCSVARVSEDLDIDEADNDLMSKPEDILHYPGLPAFTTMSTISEIDFKSHFGVNKSTVELLLGLLPEKNALGRPQLNDLTFILVSLWFLVTCEPHNSIAERFNLGKSHSHRVVVDFCSMLTDLSPEYITWPDRSDAMTTIDTFKNNYGFPGVMGVLNHSHMMIKCPAFDALNYCNGSGKYSVYLQTVILPTLHFSYVFAGWPGSCTDEEVLLKSPLLPRLFREPSVWVPDASHLVSRGAFSLQTFLMTPYKDNGCLNPAQSIYNNKHAQVCIVGDYALGLLKKRFTRLTRLEVLKMDLLTKIIVACCVMHNICLEERDTFQDLLSESSFETSLDYEIPSPEAELKRDTIANSLLLM